MSKIKKLTEQDVNPETLSGQTLAYLGDAVYETFIRKHLIRGGVVRPQVLQRDATHYVSAKAQAGLVMKLIDDGLLSEKEQGIFKRGRNAKTYTKAKHTQLRTYQFSTGFECLIGYLNLAGQDERVAELARWCIKTVEDGGLADYEFE
ncbi:Mini-ribonuclease 3 [Lactobacillus corticis]|uniref:Mini-ribonuclease 3 n=1 Tax=Lactobacillus corticis TaxID=2201249 RepID=A0A916QKF7_9LACO|nr:ribonuclease III domain-containing protein [Lactobacillus corticis]GFZ27597.1 mini-ribonuclease 3 [Lactobacillus corticis]